jgi:N-acetyl-gamma-glutamyl-phosphate reductase
MEKQIRAGVIGGAGYAGGELVRILMNHPAVTISFVQSSSNAGKPLHAVHQDMAGDTDLHFARELSQDIDVLFLCVGHGDARKFIGDNPINEEIRLIDLSQDFRLSRHASIGNRSFVYGLPELNREQIKTAANVANPGCFATAIQLGLLPLAKAGLLNEIYTTGITGSTGAGQALNATAHFSWRANNIQAYKTLEHQHLHEIAESLGQLQPSGPIDISFVPWRGDFTRGIFISSQLKTDAGKEELNVMFDEYYRSHPFVSVSKEPIFLKQVVNTNKCMIHLEKLGSKLVVHSAVDNLLKGASGQAVQNMNLMFGLDETDGLKLKANYF